ncbi:MAG: tetratricopeptide repeat protein [Pleurocapsa sp. MO_192.B19]|nr:tetratricopeptide repeat protein [Pleurocapsa sp. MO_192.B19]
MSTFLEAQQLCSEGNLEGVVALYRQAIEQYPNFSWYHVNLGEVLLQLGRKGEAVECYRNALEIQPNLLGINDILKTIEQDLQSRNNSNKCNNLGTKKQSQDKQYQDSLTKTKSSELSKIERDNSEVKNYYQLLEATPNDPKLYSKLANALVKHGLIDNAIVFYKMALKIKPDDFEVNFNLGNILAKQGKLERASIYYSSAIKINPNDFECHQKSGAVLEQLGRVSEAIASYRRALEIKENSLTEQNNLEAVIEMYHRALRVQSHSSHSTTFATGFNNRVLFALHSSFPYSHTGYCTRSHSIITALVNHGIDIVAATRLGYPWCEKNYQEKPKVKQDEIDNIKYVRCLTPGETDKPISSSKYPEYIEAYGNELIKLAKNHKASIIHSSSNHVNGLASALAAHKIGIASIYEVRGLWYLTRAAKDPSYENGDAYDLDKEMEFKAVNAADAVVTLGEALREEIVSWGIEPEKVIVVPNSVNLDKFQPLPCDRNLKRELGVEGRFVVGFLGSVTIYEGLDLLIKAIANLIDLGIKISLVIVGDGPELEELKPIAKSTSASEQIIFTGRVSFEEVNRYYSIFDVCPLPRKSYEVCRLVPPLKPLEIMAMKKPVIVSNLPALQEIVEDGKNGLICQADDINSLQQTLMSLYSDPEKKEKLGKAGRDWVEIHRSWDRVSETYLQLYKTLAGGEL